MGKAKKRAVVIGGQGFLGYSMSMHLYRDGWDVSVLDIVDTDKYRDISIKVFVGSIFNKNDIRESLQGADIVFYFASHSIPSNAQNNLSYELQNTLLALDNILSIMVELNVKKLVFPSSGGTIYGELKGSDADELTPLNPLNSYAVGKLLSEEIIKYYNRTNNIEYLIVRISNIYGCSFFRKVEQGAVDIFIQNILTEKPITIWDNADKNVRDYIFIDDLCYGILALIKNDKVHNDIYNIGTGQGHNLLEIIEIIEKITHKKAIIKREENKSSGVSKNILNINKMYNDCGWKPTYSLYNGINETIKRKWGIDSNET